jgi:hypothetical protein
LGLFDLFEDVKENSRKRKQADEYRRRAKKYVEDGERLYEKTYSDVVSYANETRYKIEQHYRYKQDLVRKISKEVNPVLKRFSDFDIDRKVIDMPQIDSSSFGTFSGGGLFASFTDGPPTISGGAFLLDILLGDADEEYWEARRQRDEAKRFYEDMKYEREKLRNEKEKMRDIRYFISDEKQLLENLIQKIGQITSLLDSGMKKSSFNKSEADYLKSVHKIAEQINGLISKKFLNDNFTINKQYYAVFENIKAIDHELSEAPTITDGTETLRKIMKLIASNQRL